MAETGDRVLWRTLGDLRPGVDCSRLMMSLLPWAGHKSSFATMKFLMWNLVTLSDLTIESRSSCLALALITTRQTIQLIGIPIKMHLSPIIIVHTSQYIAECGMIGGASRTFASHIRLHNWTSLNFECYVNKSFDTSLQPCTDNKPCFVNSL